MPLPANERAEDSGLWQLVHWLAPAVLLAAALILIPPGTIPYPPGSDFSDAALAHWPAANYLRESLLQHSAVPLWSDMRMLGQPFAANPLNKVWYPPQWLVLLLPPTLHLDVLIYLHGILLASGMLVWARAERLNAYAGLFAALAWGLNPKLMAHLGAGHLDIVYALAWAPWVLWAGLRLIDQPSLRRALTLAMLAALLVLADVRMAFYLLPLFALVGLARVIDQRSESGERDPRKIVGFAAIAIGALVLLVAVQIVPLLALSSALTRAQITASEAAVFSLPRGYLVGLFLPDVGGFHEWMTYTGLAVLMLAPLGIVRWQGRTGQVLAFAAAAILSLLWAFGEHGPLFMPVAHLLPVLGWFRVPARALVVFHLSLTILAAYGFDALLAHGLRPAGKLLALGAAGAGVLWGFAYVLLVPAPPINVMGSGFVLALTALSVWFAGGGVARLDSKRPLFCGMVIVILASSLVWLAVSLVEGRAPNAAEPEDQAIMTLLGRQCGIVYSPSFFMIGTVAAENGIKTLHGVDPFQLQSSSELIAQAAGVSPDGYSVVVPALPAGQGENVRMALRTAQPDLEQLANLGVGWIAAAFPMHGEGLRLDLRDNDLYVYRLDRPRESWWAVPGCSVAPNRPFDRRIDVPVPARLTVVIPALPGWVARVNGMRVPAHRTDGGLVGLDLPAGDAVHVELIYRPVPDIAAALLSLGAWITAWLITGRRSGGRDG